MSDEKETAHSCEIRLMLDEATGQVSASIHLGPAADEPDEQALNALLKAGGYGSFYPLNRNRKALLKAVRQAQVKLARLAEATATEEDSGEPDQEPATPRLQDLLTEEELTHVIAERRDAIVEVSVSKDEMLATLTISRAYGGKPADLDLLRERLASAGVAAGIDDTALNAALKGEPDTPYMVAKGREPVAGEPAAFETLVTSVNIRTPAEDRQGKVDHRQRVEFVTVHPGDALMRRTPATPGVNGYTVLGAGLPAKAGDDPPFEYDGDSGASPDKHDPNLLVARVVGHPVLSATGVRIDPTLEVENVNLRTGNINFEGSLLVHGEIAEGFKVEVGGDVLVNDSVSKVQIRAGGNVQIMHGCIGGDPDSAGKDENGAQIYPSRIECKGSFTARFLSLADVQAGEMVLVEEYIRHSRVQGQQILVGMPDGKGIVQGGHLRAADSIMARVFGSPGGVPTTIEVGEDNSLQLAAYRASRRELKTFRDKLGEIKRIGGQLMARAKAAGAPPAIKEKLLKLVATKKHLEYEIDRLEGASRELAREAAINEAYITGLGTFHSNVQLIIGGVKGTIRNERCNCTYTLEQGRFVRRKAEVEEGEEDPEAEIDDIAEEPAGSSND